MGKKTDYKKLWRKEKKRNLRLSRTIANMNDIIKGQVDILGKVKRGEIDPKEILK